MTIFGAELGLGQLLAGLIAAFLMALGAAGRGTQSQNIRTLGAIFLFGCTGWALYSDGIIAGVIVFVATSLVGGALTSVVRQMLWGR